MMCMREPIECCRAANASGQNAKDNENHITFDEFRILTRRMDRMEYSVGNIVSRVSTVDGLETAGSSSVWL